MKAILMEGSSGKIYFSCYFHEILVYPGREEKLMPGVRRWGVGGVGEWGDCVKSCSHCCGPGRGEGRG